MLRQNGGRRPTNNIPSLSANTAYRLRTCAQRQGNAEHMHIRRVHKATYTLHAKLKPKNPETWAADPAKYPHMARLAVLPAVRCRQHVSQPRACHACGRRRATETPLRKSKATLGQTWKCAALAPHRQRQESWTCPQALVRPQEIWGNRTALPVKSMEKGQCCFSG